MDLATLIGIVGGFVVILGAILVGGSLGLFVDVPSILIVVGGSLFVVSVKFSPSQLAAAFKIAFIAFKKPKSDPNDVLEKLVELGTVAQRGGGPLALEKVEVADPFLAKGVQMVVDGTEPDLIRRRMGLNKKSSIGRHLEGQRIFRALGEVSPGMGMIGTLIGLVQMLANMDDPSSIGPAMAVALLTTLYGSVIANVFAIPIADKLQKFNGDEDLQRSMMIDALCDIAKRVNPRVMAENLENYLPGGKKTGSDEDKGANNDAKGAKKKAA
jgi:chemotaxis protein MotA